MNFIHGSNTLADKTAGQIIHATSRRDFIHGSNTSNTQMGKTAGQIIHAVKHVNHAAVIHENHHPFRGGS